MTVKPACTAHPDLDWHSANPAEQEACKEICARCPLAVSCEADARARGERWGIWGGANLNVADETADDWAELPPAHLRVSVYAPEHGSRARYVSGCRCADCTKANTAFVAERRSTLAFEPVKPVAPAVEPPLSLFKTPAVTARRKVNA